MHDHDHHGHGHHHAVPDNFDRAFQIGIALNLAIVVGQVVFGFYAHSLALLADAAHNFSDAIGLVLAFAGALAALANAALLLVATGGIVVEAIQRLMSPAPIEGTTVIVVAAVAVLLNGATALLFMRGRHDDLNVRGAFLHMAADAALSLGVVVAAVLTIATGWLWLDPLMGLVIGAVILWGTGGLARDTIRLALDAVPERIDHGDVDAWLRALPGVSDVHDLHIWGMSTREAALTVHLVRPGAALDDGFLAMIRHELEHDFGIAHATVQVETGDPAHPCGLAPAHVV